MSDCWVCNQRAEVKNEKMNAIRAEAKKRSTEEGKTMAIVQMSGCVYKVIGIDEVNGQKVKEYLSANSS